MAEKQNLTPEPNGSTRHAAAGNLAFLLSVVRCGESLSADEEANVRNIIKRLELEDDFTKHLAERHATLAETSRTLCEKLYAVHNDPRYRRVWEIAQSHRGPYDGPTYTVELSRLESMLRQGRMEADGITEEDIEETRMPKTFQDSER